MYTGNERADNERADRLMKNEENESKQATKFHTLRKRVMQSTRGVLYQADDDYHILTRNGLCIVFVRLRKFSADIINTCVGFTCPIQPLFSCDL